MMITQLLNVSGDKKYKFEARCKAQFMIRPQLLATSESERSGSHGKVSFFYSVCSCRTGISGGLRQRPCGITEPKEEVKK